MEDVDIVMVVEDHLSLLIVPGHLDGTRAPRTCSSRKKGYSLSLEHCSLCSDILLLNVVPNLSLSPSHRIPWDREPQ